MIFTIVLLALLTSMHLLSVALAAIGMRRVAAEPKPSQRPPISVLRPVRGLENHIEQALRSSFTLDYPQFEILFCVAEADDPALPLIDRLIAAYPQADARILVGDERLCANPKLNNIAKGWRTARHDLVVMSDSNVDLPPDYLHQLVARLHDGVGLVSVPGIGSLPEGLWAELECAFLNTHQARCLFASEMVGLGYAHGKTMLMRRADVERAGGFDVLNRDIAEDSAATKAMRGIGKEVRLGLFNVFQPLGRRSFSEVWSRQVRWSRLRRASFPVPFGLEILAGILPALALMVWLVVEGPLDPLLIPGFVVLWYGAEAGLAAAAGWRLALHSPLYWALRDLLIPALWLAGWSRTYVWRGHRVDLVSRTLLRPKEVGGCNSPSLRSTTARRAGAPVAGAQYSPSEQAT
jgi:ceramide glucosyltransferase